MADDFTTEAFTLLGFGLVIIAFRIYCQLTKLGWRHLQVDDYVMLLAAVVYSLETAAAYSVGAKYQGLANNGMSDAERAALDPESEEYHTRVGGSKLQLMGWSSYTLLLWLLKLTLYILYSRLTKDVVGLVILPKIGLGVLLVSYLATELSILFGCGLPFEKNWQINPDPGNYCTPAISKIDVLVTVVLNVATDLYLMSIGFALLWMANMPRRKKITLVVIFSGGIFVMTAGILRCVLILTDPVNGAQQAGSWAVRETFVAVFTTNVPIIYPTAKAQISRISRLPVITSITSKVSSTVSKNSSNIGTALSSKKGGSGGFGMISIGGTDESGRKVRKSMKRDKWAGLGLTTLGSKVDLTTVNETELDERNGRMTPGMPKHEDVEKFAGLTYEDAKQFDEGSGSGSVDEIRRSAGTPFPVEPTAHLASAGVGGLDFGNATEVESRRSGVAQTEREGSEDGILPVMTNVTQGSEDTLPPHRGIAVTRETNIDIERASQSAMSERDWEGEGEGGEGGRGRGTNVGFEMSRREVEELVQRRESGVGRGQGGKKRAGYSVFVRHD